MRKPNLNERIQSTIATIADDLIIFCGADAFTGRILHDFLNRDQSFPVIKSIHQYRKEQGHYDFRYGVMIMGRKSPSFYSDAFAFMHRNEGHNMVSFCRYDVSLMAAVVERLKSEHKIYARVYFLPSKLGFSLNSEAFVFNSPESGDNE